MMYYPVNQYRQDLSRIMTVTGSASLSEEPDIIRIQLEVITENEQLSIAQKENANKMARVIQALIQAGISRESIQTTAYRIVPIYDYIDGKQELRGYSATNAITVKIRDVSQAGEIVDVAVQHGVNQVSDIQFSLENKDILYQRALSAALQNAASKARTIAGTLNINYDPIPTKIEEELQESPRAFKTFAAAESNISTPIEPGEITIHAVVEAQFRY